LRKKRDTYLSRRQHLYTIYCSGLTRRSPVWTGAGSIWCWRGHGEIVPGGKGVAEQCI